LKSSTFQIVTVLCLVFLLLSLPNSGVAQTFPKYPKGYFRWPLSLAPDIVANMGELRDNHWHMGLDIRTNQKVNQLVYAAAEGYIAHVGIRPLGFGRFITINHPNGLSTLYAHLNDFNPELEEYVTEQQYQKESWAVELEIPKGRFPVTKGSFIAYSGSTGGSQGPHVHFEIRSTATNECLNPLFFGFDLPDKVNPSMTRLAIYDRNLSLYEQAPRFVPLKNTPAGFVIPNIPVLKSGTQKLSFGIQAFDRRNGTNNQDGIYAARLFLDDELQTSFQIDSVDYDETRYMNAQIDYRYHVNGGGFLQHLSKLPGDNGGVYHTAASDGIIELTDTSTHDVRIELGDSYGNISTLRFKLKYEAGISLGVNAEKLRTPLFMPAQVNVLEQTSFEAYLPEKALYDLVSPSYYTQASHTQYAVSALHQFGNETIPLQENMRVRIKIDKPLPEEWKNKLLIRLVNGRRTANRLAKWQDEISLTPQWVVAEFNEFGNFQVFADVIPPSFGELGSGDTINLSAAKRIAFTPVDNFGIKSFRAELNNQWLRFTNDKGRTWVYAFDERVPYGVHKLKIIVEDIAGNITTKTWWFKKYAYKAPVRKKAATRKKSVKKKRK
jgi:murein DD-endopeptidase MepM/ murein hydrolase activator NlpD